MSHNGGWVGPFIKPSTKSNSGVWTLKEQQYWNAARKWPGPQDPLWTSVKVMIHGDTDINDPAVFLNKASALNVGFTVVTNSTLSSRQLNISNSITPLFGAATCLLCGGRSAGALGTDSTSVVGTISTGDFAIECWFYNNVAGQSAYLVALEGGLAGIYPGIGFTGGACQFFTTATGTGTTRINGGTPSLNTWHFLEASRVSGNTRLFLDGTQVGSTYVDANNYGASHCFIGGNFSGNSVLFSGAMQEIRVTRGAGRNTANYSVPTAPFPDY